MSNIYPQSERYVQRQAKEKLLNQYGKVVWLYGLSGSGKSTVAASLDKKLHAESFLTAIMDGDDMRMGLNNNLGFTDEDRSENIRRNAEVAKLLIKNGLVVISAVITPLESQRLFLREMLGDDLLQIYIKADYETCLARDPKGLYKKVESGKVESFTGKQSQFEEPTNPDMVVDTSKLSVEESVDHIYERLIKNIMYN